MLADELLVEGTVGDAQVRRRGKADENVEGFWLFLDDLEKVGGFGFGEDSQLVERVHEEFSSVQLFQDSRYVK